VSKTIKESKLFGDLKK